MKIEIKRNFPSLAKLQLTTPALMREIGLLARERIYKRTVSGRDEHDESFTPYSRSYAAKKGGELGTSSVNLQVSGAMLNAMRVTHVTENSVDIEIAS